MCIRDSLRTIPIDPVGLLPFLKEIHDIDSQRLREASTLGLRDLADGYVVSRPDGSFATTSYIRRAFKTFSETCLLYTSLTPEECVDEAFEKLGKELSVIAGQRNKDSVHDWKDNHTEIGRAHV